MQLQARRDTAPELALRSALFRLGMRYRVGYRVPGMMRRTIDIAFTRARVAVMVHGCYWHGCRQHKTIPVANREWWQAKIATNVARDAATRAHLETLGWLVLEIWEHDDPAAAARSVADAVRRRGVAHR
jgi:DNA mismatch endonuclease (patch repair protein)